jgi:hypothetical protein
LSSRSSRRQAVAPSVMPPLVILGTSLGFTCSSSATRTSTPLLHRANARDQPPQGSAQARGTCLSQWERRRPNCQPTVRSPGLFLHRLFAHSASRTDRADLMRRPCLISCVTPGPNRLVSRAPAALRAGEPVPGRKFLADRERRCEEFHRHAPDPGECWLAAPARVSTISCRTPFRGWP